MLIWTEEFQSGWPQVDEQHRHLIDQLNAFEQLLNEGNVTPENGRLLLDELGAHCTAHFSYEEDCMERERCPAHLPNRLAHTAFLKTFHEFRGRYQTNGHDSELLRSLHGAATRWIQSHILTHDVQMRACIRKHGGPTATA